MFSLPFAREAEILDKDEQGKLSHDEVNLKPLAKGPKREI